jgi:hypothetical protein
MIFTGLIELDLFYHILKIRQNPPSGKSVILKIRRILGNISQIYAASRKMGGFSKK